MMHICHAWMLLISCGTVLMISEIHVQKHDSREGTNELHIGCSLFHLKQRIIAFYNITCSM